MTSLAPILESVFTRRLLGQRQASPNTIAAYRDALRLLLQHARQETGKDTRRTCAPLDRNARAQLKTWMKEQRPQRQDPLFPGLNGQKLTRDGVTKLIARHVTTAIATIALWLGHGHIRTTQIYLHADLALKQPALDKTAPPHIQRGRYRPADDLLAFLERL